MLVPRRSGVRVTPFGGRERVRRDAGGDGLAAAVDVVEPVAVGQRRVSSQHRLIDLDARFGAAAGCGDARATTVDQTERLRVLDADAQGSAGIAFAPRWVTEDVVGGVGPPLADR